MEAIKHTQFLNPREVLKTAGVSAGAAVADFGCASGYFSLPCADIVGEEGSVIAIDVLPEALEAVKSNAKMRGIHNILTRHANLEIERGSQIDQGTLDWVIMKNVLFMSTDRAGMLTEAMRVLSEDGRILVVEWNAKKVAGTGPSEEKRISKDEVIRLFEDARLHHVNSVDAGDYHYGMVFEKKI